MATSIEENFRFMVLETRKQLEGAVQMIKSPNPKVLDKMRERDNYIDVLNNLIQRKCFSPPAKRSQKTMDYLLAIDTISRNIEHIGDYSVSIVRQCLYFRHPRIIDRFEYQAISEELVQAINCVPDALFSKNIETALKICRSEFKSDEVYAQVLKRILNELPAQKDDAGDLVTCLFIFELLERAGDAILNIGEAVISMCLGEKIRVNEFAVFRELGTNLGIMVDGPRANNVSFKMMGETRSGCKTDKIDSRKKEQPREKRDVVFKHGSIRKIQQEKERLERWSNIFPGLTPKVLGYQAGQQDASLLMEFVKGVNVKEMVLSSSTSHVKTAMTKIQLTLSEVWEKTLKDEVIPLETVKQIQDRIDDVYQVHPEFNLFDKEGKSLDMRSFRKLLEKAKQVETNIAAPFSVWTHGDFNLDNILYNAREKKVHVVDVYRSRQYDYVQDISVFIISGFRIPEFDIKLRERITAVIIQMYQFGKEFARRHDDHTFAVRLAFGLARSFVTSTRFEFNENFSRLMMLRAFFILEKILDHRGKGWESFDLPEEILIY